MKPIQSLPLYSCNGIKAANPLRSLSFWLPLALAAAAVLCCVEPSLANVIPKPKLPPGGSEDDIIGTMLAIFKEGANAALIFMLIGAFVVAAAVGVIGLLRGITRGEWSLLWIGLLAALIVLAFIGIILYQGGQVLDSVGGGGGAP